MKCVTGLLFYKIQHGFRSCYVRHIWVRDRSLFIAKVGEGGVAEDFMGIT